MCPNSGFYSSDLDPYSHDNDYDARPGNQENSAPYTIRYDPQNELEYTNLPENASQLEAANLLRTRDEYIRGLRSELSDTLQRIQYWPHAGRFVIPKQNSYASHLALVREGHTVDIHFDPKTYLYFDRIIAERANKPELFSPNHPDYPKYQNLRDNLAVLRNDIMGAYMDDGSFDPGEERYLPRLAQMAAVIGDALGADNKIEKIFVPTLDTEIANIEGEGAAYIYQFLTQRQVSNTPTGKMWGKFRSFMSQPNHQWELPNIEQTAFSQTALSMQAPKDELCNCTRAELRQRASQLVENLQRVDPGNTDAIENVTMHERREAVEHGKLILEWLRNIKFSDKGLRDFIDSGRPGEPNVERDAMNILVASFHQVMETAVQNNPGLLDNQKIKEAYEIVEVLEHATMLMAKLEKPVSHADTMQISIDTTQQPDKWHELSAKTVDRLMDTLKGGLEEAVMEMQQQQADIEQQQEEQLDVRMEDILASQGNSKRRKKRAASGKGYAKQRKIDLAIRADDYALGQGVHADEKPAKQAVRKTTERTPQNASPLLPPAMREPLAETANPVMPTDTHAMHTTMNNDLVKQLGKQLMAMQQQANIAASELPDMAGGGLQSPTGPDMASQKENAGKSSTIDKQGLPFPNESFKDRQRSPKTKTPTKPQIG